MKKLIAIAFLTLILTSCGSLQFGDYNRWQQVNGNKVNCNK